MSLNISMSGGWAALTAINWTRGRTRRGGRREFSSINMKNSSPPFSGQIGINKFNSNFPLLFVVFCINHPHTCWWMLNSVKFLDLVAQWSRVETHWGFSCKKAIKELSTSRTNKVLMTKQAAPPEVFTWERESAQLSPLLSK